LSPRDHRSRDPRSYRQQSPDQESRSPEVSGAERR
jgi:hypothetical protein